MTLLQRFRRAIAQAYRRAIPSYPAGDDDQLGEFLMTAIRKDARELLADEPVTLELTGAQCFAIIEALEDYPHQKRNAENHWQDLQGMFRLLEDARRMAHDVRIDNKHDKRLRKVAVYLGLVAAKGKQIWHRGERPETIIRYFESLCGKQRSTHDGKPIGYDPDTGEHIDRMTEIAALERTTKRFRFPSVEACKIFIRRHRKRLESEYLELLTRKDR